MAKYENGKYIGADMPDDEPVITNRINEYYTKPPTVLPEDIVPQRTTDDLANIPPPIPDYKRPPVTVVQPSGNDNYEEIQAAAQKGLGIENPYFTNIPGVPRGTDPRSIVRITQEPIPPKPDEESMAKANQIMSFRNHLMQNAPGNLASQADKNAFNKFVDYSTKKFYDELEGGKGSLYKVVMPDGTIAYKSRAEAQDMTAPSPAGTGLSGDPKKSFETWTPEQKEYHFKNKIISGKDPGFSSRDVAGKTSFNKEFGDYLSSMGLTPEDASKIKSEASGFEKSINVQQKSRDMMEGFIKNIDSQVDKVTNIMKGDDIKRFGIRVADQPIRELKTRLAGSGAERVLESYLREISTEIAKVTTGSQASIAEVSVEAQKVWNNIHDKNLSFPELIKVLEATKQQGALRLKSADDVLTSTQEKQMQIIDNHIARKKGIKTEQPKQTSQDNIYIDNGKEYNIPQDKVAAFLKARPNAKKR